jgi:aminopeptidase N
MRTMVQDQKKANKPNRERNIEIIKTAMAKLL